MDTRFGPLLRKIREDAGVTMGGLARYLGVSVPYLSHVEREKRPPLARERIKAAGILMDLTSEKLNQLLSAAADWQGFFELGANVSPAGKRAGAALARGWESLNDSRYDQLRELIEEDEPNGEVPD